MVLKVPHNEVHRNEWGELVCNVYDEDDIFLRTERINEKMFMNNGAVVPVDWETKQGNDFSEMVSTLQHTNFKHGIAS